MKLSIYSHSLRDAISKILTVIDKKTSRQILTNFLISAKGDHLEIVTSNIEVTAKVLVDANIEDGGVFCINSRSLSEIFRELPEALIEMSIDKTKNMLNIHCKNINYSLLVSNSEDFPQVNFNQGSTPIVLSTKSVVNIVNKTSHAVSTDETRINLNGIYLQQLDNKLRAVAIDGHRLALVDLIDFDSNNNFLKDGVILPKKGIHELKKLADSYPNDDFILNLDESFLYVSVKEEHFLTIRLIAREYPKYQTVIPAKTSYSFSIERAHLLNAIKRIKLLSNEKTNGVKLSISSTELKVSADHPALGHAIEVLPIEYSGADMEIGFNARYMLDALSILDVNEILYEFNNELNPVIMRSREEENFLGIIMPLKV